MANLAQSGVTIERAWSEGHVTGKDISCRKVALVLSTMGTVTNNIPASVLSLTKIEQSTPAVKDDNTVIVPTGPSNDGTLLLLGGGASNAPADYTGTFRLVVKGY